MELPNKEALAAQFVAILAAWLTPAEFAEMQKRNAAMPKGSTSCASHDFCDANMAMAQAFEDLGFPDFDPADENQAHRWNEAWELAMTELGGRA